MTDPDSDTETPFAPVDNGVQLQKLLHLMTPFAGTMGKLHGNARSPVVSETPRPDVSGDRRFRPTFQSSFSCKRY